MKGVLPALLVCAALLAPGAHSATVLRIACGSSTGGTDAAGHPWQADAYASGGTDYSRANMATLDLPYRALRYGSFAYTLPAVPGKYTVTLHFLENRTATSVPPIATGQRKISISINGAVAVASLDLFAAAGSMMPQSVSFPVTASGPITIAVSSLPGSLPGLLSGIQLDSAEVVVPPTAARGPCEYPIGWAPGGYFSQVIHVTGCWNTTGSPLTIATVRCWTDGSNVNVLSVMLPDAKGEPQTVIPDFPCTSNAPPQIVQAPPGVYYANNTGITFAMRIMAPEIVDGATQVSPGQFVVVVTYEPYVPPVAKLEAINTCIGSGPGWDCAGLYWVKVAREDGSILDVIGPKMLPPPSSVSFWDVVR